MGGFIVSSDEDSDGDNNQGGSVQSPTTATKVANQERLKTLLGQKKGSVPSSSANIQPSLRRVPQQSPSVAAQTTHQREVLKGVLKKTRGIAETAPVAKSVTQEHPLVAGEKTPSRSRIPTPSLARKPMKACIDTKNSSANGTSEDADRLNNIDKKLDTSQLETTVAHQIIDAKPKNAHIVVIDKDNKAKEKEGNGKDNVAPTTPRAEVKPGRGKHDPVVMAPRTEAKPVKQHMPIPESRHAYFEYSVHQKAWNEVFAQDTLEVTSQPHTNLYAANNHAEAVFNALRTQHVHLKAMEWSSKQDEHDCTILTGVFSPMNDPGTTIHHQVWVERHVVSKYAPARKSGSISSNHQISMTVYHVKLYKLFEINGEVIRTHHAHASAASYTTPQGANTAARNMQIEMTGSKDEASLVALNEQLHKLNMLAGNKVELWKSEFVVGGQERQKYQLVVESGLLRGPLNL